MKHHIDTDNSRGVQSNVNDVNAVKLSLKNGFKSYHSECHIV